MKKILSSLIVFYLILSVVGSIPSVVSAGSSDESCAPNSQIFVSSAGDIVNGDPAFVTSFEHSWWIPSSSLSDGAAWIWHDAKVVDASSNETNVFTKTINVAGNFVSANIDIAADNGYSIKVNGSSIVDKLAIGDNFEALSSHALTFNSGSNTLEITVVNFGSPGSNFESNPAGLLYRLVVNSCTPSVAPTANAGLDQTIIFPTNSVTLDGSGISSNTGGSITSYVWSFVSGPSTIDPADTASTTITDLLEGTYVFQLTVTDNNDATATDTVSIVVNQTPSNVNGGGNIIQSSGGRIGGFIAPVTPIVGQVLGAETSCGIYVDKFLRVGYKNDINTVTKVQQFLNDSMHAGLALDGVYGIKTEAAVKNFQLAHADKVLAPWNITASTGIFYLTTQTEMNNIMCSTLELPVPTNLIPFSANSQSPLAISTGNVTLNN